MDNDIPKCDVILHNILCSIEDALTLCGGEIIDGLSINEGMQMLETRRFQYILIICSTEGMVIEHCDGGGFVHIDYHRIG